MNLGSVLTFYVQFPANPKVPSKLLGQQITEGIALPAPIPEHSAVGTELMLVPRALPWKRSHRCFLEPQRQLLAHTSMQRAAIQGLFCQTGTFSCALGARDHVCWLSCV